MGDVGRWKLAGRCRMKEFVAYTKHQTSPSAIKHPTANSEQLTSKHH